MKKLLIFGSLALLPSLSYATIDAIDVFQGDRQVAQIKISDLPKVVSENGTLKITAGSKQLEFSDGITVKFAKQSSMNSINDEIVSYYMLDSQIIISNLKALQLVQLYSISGVQIDYAIANEDGEAVLEIPINGCYIVKTSNLSFKIVK